MNAGPNMRLLGNADLLAKKRHLYCSSGASCPSVIVIDKAANLECPPGFAHVTM